MMQTISITPRWQIHIPVEFRRILGLEKPGIAEITIAKDAIVIKPRTSPILKLAGKYHKRKQAVKIDIDKIREQIDYSKV